VQIGNEESSAGSKNQRYNARVSRVRSPFRTRFALSEPCRLRFRIRI
jgi:hypothetical protein